MFALFNTHSAVMLCLRALRLSPLSSIRQLSVSSVRQLSDGHGSDNRFNSGRNIVRNPQKFQKENPSAIKELEVPNMEADYTKPAKPGAKAFVPHTHKVMPRADLEEEVPSHYPEVDGPVERRGCMTWRQADGCLLCNLDLDLSWHNVALLYQFVTDSGTILGPRTTGLCQTSHQILVDAIHTSRDLGLMAHDYKPLEYKKSRLIFDIKNPKAGLPGPKDAGY